MKILLIEDDIQICTIIQKYFVDRNAEIRIISDGALALKQISEGLQDFSLILLDIMLPGVDGFTICRTIRKKSAIPILFITAKRRESDILKGYELGCDDYIVKPFLLSALYAKCNAILRRNSEQKTRILTCGAIKLDIQKLTCFVDGKEIDLTQKEFAILQYLMQHIGWVVDRETLLNMVWGDDYIGIDRVVDNQIKRLRKSLGSARGQIHTVIGRGYKLTD